MKTHGIPHNRCVCTIHSRQCSGSKYHIFKVMGSMSAVNTGWEILAEEVERVEAFYERMVSSVHANDAVLPTSKTERVDESTRLLQDALDDVF